ncbi:MAG TPA: hypothetical protein VK654_04375 [Nitrospirota bacterium]|nr:hypothetical protein [Nitrospirota bacterium]
MKIFDVAGKVAPSGEYLLGSRETGSHACYLIYGVLKPGERDRELKPGHGHEEIILAVSGDLQCSGKYSGILRQGQAVHMIGEETVSVENRGKESAVYVICGGHSGGGHAH